MSVTDTIAENGDYRLSNLKAATQILSNSLFAHGPSGVNVVRFSDFVCKALGHNSGGTPPDFTRLLRPGAVNGDETDADGSYGSGDPPFFAFSTIDELNAQSNDTFTVRVELYGIDRGRFFAEQIAKGQINVTDPDPNLNLVDTSIVSGSTGDEAIDFKFEVTGFAGSVQVGLTYNAELNTNADNAGKSTTDGEGNSLPEDAGLAFRTKQINDGTSLLERWEVRVKDDGTVVTFDFNVDSNDNNIGESAVMYDPAGQVNAQFFMYDEFPGNKSPYANDTEPDFLSSNHFQQNVSDFSESSGNRAKTFFCEVEDQGGNVVDVVEIVVDENDTGTWGSTRECYTYTTTVSRNRGTLSSPVTMNFQGSC